MCCNYINYIIRRLLPKWSTLSDKFLEAVVVMANAGKVPLVYEVSTVP